LVLLIITAVIDKIILTTLPGLGLTDSALTWLRAGIHLLVNILIGLGLIRILKSYQIKARRVVAKPTPIAVAPEPPASVIS
jgi:hypothetical protein